MHNKKSRQVIRKENRIAFKEQEALRKEGARPVKMADFTQVTQYVQELSNRIASLELTIASLHRLLLDSEVIDNKKFDATVKFEQDRAVKFQEIQKSTDTYEVRLGMCSEWKIPVEATVIPSQIKEDVTLDTAAKLALAAQFDFSPDLVAEQETPPETQ